ncbi:MAG: leucyl aminopeptidase family protein, partial [Mycoplasmataceae bacterium]|nr:leucyl aminopeptidase family protein [Mycoplasmataceae bacterium]
PSSKEKTTYVGKGIMFDSGGYSIKTGRHMSGMKYDMSGSAIIAGAMKLISKNKPKANISAVLMLTDNSIGTSARSVDGVDISMSGKTVEVNNTDAEGRLVLADGITYAIKKLNTTRIIDVATLTGAVLVALGNTYTGVWTTEEKDWETVSKAAKVKDELVWRLPFHEDFDKYIKNSKIADLRNTDFTGKGGSSSAAGFLRHFTEGKPFVHFDIAGTADVNENATAVMTKTLAEAAND